MKKALLFATLGAAALVSAPAMAQVQIGTPSVGIGAGPSELGSSSAPSSRYAMPPARMTPPSALDGVDLDSATLEGLEEIVDDIEVALSDCQSTARRLNMELSTNRGQEAVHPDWIRSYQDCLQQQEEDIAKVKDVVESHSGDTERVQTLSESIDDLEDELDDAFSTQQRLVSEYNFN